MSVGLRMEGQERVTEVGLERSKVEGKISVKMNRLEEVIQWMS